LQRCRSNARAPSPPNAGNRWTNRVGFAPATRQSSVVSSILQLCEAVPVRTFEPGTILLAEGKKSGLLYVLLDGQVEIRKRDFQINTVSEPGAIFGEISVLLDVPHMATVRTVTASRLHVIENGEAFLRSKRDIAFDLSKLLAQRLLGITTYLAELKSDYEDQKDHLDMVHLIVETLAHQQPQTVKLVLDVKNSEA
jgi:CRP-like cAMP-binding protein